MYYQEMYKCIEELEMKILIIDDEKNIGIAIMGIVNDEGNISKHALTFSKGMELLKEETFDIVFLDIWLPDIDGMEGLKEIKRYYPEIDVVMISGHGTIENAVESIKYGAYDFLEKPLSLERIVMILKHLKDRSKLLKDLRNSKYNLIKKYNLIGVSPAVNRLKDKIDQVSNMNSVVLITGENGTGKEHVSKLIHMLGMYSDQPLIEINCSAVPSEFLEGELFGYEQGAFPDALALKKGMFELAVGGTLFLDEICDMDLSTQIKLLKVLEMGEFSKIGSTEIIKSNFRLICATNKDISAEIANNNFRADLFYKINVIPIEVPPLRERKEDIPYLVNYFLKSSSSLNSLLEKRLSNELMDKFMSYDFPGNVRQLKNIVERLVVLSDNEVIEIDDTPAIFMNDSSSKSVDSSLNYSATLKSARDLFEKDYFLNVLRVNDWNIIKSAAVLDIERTYLYKKIKSLGLDKNKNS